MCVSWWRWGGGPGWSSAKTQRRAPSPGGKPSTDSWTPRVRIHFDSPPSWSSFLFSVSLELFPSSHSCRSPFPGPGVSGSGGGARGRTPAQLLPSGPGQNLAVRHASPGHLSAPGSVHQRTGERGNTWSTHSRKGKERDVCFWLMLIGFKKFYICKETAKHEHTAAPQDRMRKANIISWIHWHFAVKHCWHFKTKTKVAMETWRLVPWCRTGSFLGPKQPNREGFCWNVGWKHTLEFGIKQMQQKK